MSFYLKSTFNTRLVSQIHVFTLYATKKIFEYYSLYKTEPYKNTDDLMFLYRFSLVAVISLIVEQWLPQNYESFSWDLKKK